VTVDEPIRLEPYDPDWPRRFDEERRRLESALAPWLSKGIHHVGSTAIRGLAAKPIIDMVAGVSDLDRALDAFEPLRRLGYAYTPHRPEEAHHFSKPSACPASFGLHLTEPGGALWRERLAFRDALREEAALAAEYAALKERLVTAHANDLAAYTAGKRAFVARVLAARGVQIRSR
jgi:GrpB-like predicted nucleotidyltransferase (UPF0157 family)